MQKINFNDVTEQSEGARTKLPAGNYVCSITKFEDCPDKEYARLYVDIAEGEFAGYFSDPFYADKPYAHSIVMSYKPQALGMLKSRLHAISDSNPGFDAEAAWNGNNPAGQFSGRRVGVQFHEEEYIGNDGEPRVNTKPGKLFAVDKLEQQAKPRRKTKDGEWIDIPAAGAVSTAADDDEVYAIPF